MLRRLSLSGLALAVLVGTYWAWDHRHYWVLHHFRVVDPGRVYAGGYQYPAPLRRIIQRYGIRTVVSLRGDPTDRNDQIEREVLRELGVRFVRVHIPFDRSLREQLQAVEAAVRVLGDPEAQPVFVHCWGGQHRTGVVVGAYRYRYKRWSRDQVWHEFEAMGGMTADPPYAAHLLRAFMNREDRRRSRKRRAAQLPPARPPAPSP